MALTDAGSYSRSIVPLTQVYRYTEDLSSILCSNIAMLSEIFEISDDFI